MNKKLVGLVLVLTLAATLGACNSEGGTGGGGSSPGSPSPTAT
ncbi:MAG TPA: hypothetical protein V6D35_22880 [Candidatus Sericytochromatia bacterium]